MDGRAHLRAGDARGDAPISDSLADETALVTGGGTGVGLAIAKTLANRGAAVTITGRREAVLAEARVEDVRLNTFACDATDPEAMAQAVRGCSVVVANAGASMSKPFHRMEAGDLAAMLDANLVTVFETFRAALPSMREAGRGRLVVVASTAGLKGYAYVTAYVAAKHAVVGLVRALALELAAKEETRAITVNAVCPGYTDTPMLRRTIDNIVEKTGRSREAAEAPLLAPNPQGRFVEPAEVADAVAWLAGPRASAITGQAISISGGETM